MKYYFIDLFCGFGGTSYGIHGVGKDAAEVVWAVNHDPNAIASHQLNNPYVYHSIEASIYNLGQKIFPIIPTFTKKLINNNY